MILKVVFSLLIISFLEKDVLGQCTPGSLKNEAVYEGHQNIPIVCNSPTKVSWTIKPTTDELNTYTITKYDDTVNSQYTNLYGVNSNGLLIKTAQGTASPIATSGFYIIQINGSSVKYGAKLTVVRQGPNCTCNPFNSTAVNISCSIIYDDSSYQPILTRMNWTSDGNFNKIDKPTRAKVNANDFRSTSSIIVNANDPSTYKCTVTFMAPTNIQLQQSAMNAPNFSESCSLRSCLLPTTQNPTTTTTTMKVTTTVTTTTAEPPTTTTTPSTTTTESPTTTTPATTTTESPTTTTTPATTTTEPPTTTTTPATTTTEPPTTTTTPATTTTTQPPTTVPSPQCVSDVKNIAVREGQQNTIMNLYIDPQNVSWKVVPTSDELDTLTIINYGGINNYPTLYDVNQTGLIIKEATTNGNPISTAGLYIGQCANNTNRTGAKLLVVHSGPICSCIPLDYASNLSCNVTYGDSSLHPIYPIVTWKVNGAILSTATLTRKRMTNSNLFYSESTIIGNGGDPSTYTCELTFAKPTNIQFNFVATNAPEFNESCDLDGCPITTTTQRTTTATTSAPPTTTTPSTTTTIEPTTSTTSPITTTPPTTNIPPTITTPQISTTGPQCLSNVKNIAVREGQQTIIMNLYINPQNVSWKVVPTSDELDTLPIIDYGGINNYPTLYDVNQTGLIIKDATTNGDPFSTAGLYIGQCANNTNRTGAKLLVVQTGPLCSCIPLDYASNLSCNVTYADSSIQPIYAIVTWKLNGAVLSTATLPRKRNGPYVFYSESTIIGDGGDLSRYTCELTFTPPNNNQFPFVATNAPEFNESCDVNACPFTTTIRSTTLTTTAQQPTTFPPTTSSTTTAASTTTTTPYPSSTDCNCPQTTACPSPEASCTDISECRSDGTNLTDVYDECVVKAELYARCDNCCRENLVCGVVVTLRNDSRWLIHDPLCNKNTCQMVVFDASCMSTDWKLLSERKVAISGVGDYVQAGNGVQIGLNVTDCSESCKIMMNLP